MSIFDTKVESVVDGEHTLQAYEGNVLLIVNTASKCGFASQLKELQKLYEQYKDKGFYVLGFPSNQFMNQEPLADEDIPDHLQEKYGVTFPLFKKTEVRGEDVDPLFAHLTQETKGLGSNNIKWNFTKFLVGREGTVLYRYSPRTHPEKIEADLKEALK
ncbi:glutathione peroxidase [Natribacillus halophilus]|uniref:Glutathione peroxidase n=1 Tax=Natribacillus halophilus TaxID=549003 RepID=A0A1G8LDI9_9BACI|nr:glutathione peroxidase [Natribacillus halophilus]SDI53778.1 glutathione peroxidase [Natribacillus halophilus]